MLLRSLTKHVKDQNWFAVFLDFFIVVAGILIAFQITNWNEARMRDQTEKIYIERIREDLSENKADFTERFTYLSQVRGHALNALNSLEQKSDNLGEQFLIDIYQATNMVPRAFGRDTYDELISTGGNNAIAELDVRKRLSNFYRSNQAQLTLLENRTPYRNVVRRQMPYAVTLAIHKACGDISSTGAAGQPGVNLPTECQPGLETDQITDAVTALRAQNIQADLAQRLDDLDRKLWAINIILERVELLDAYLTEVQQ